jgi:hypothetical protein
MTDCMDSYSDSFQREVQNIYEHYLNAHPGTKPLRPLNRMIPTLPYSTHTPPKPVQQQSSRTITGGRWNLQQQR